MELVAALKEAVQVLSVPAITTVEVLERLKYVDGLVRPALDEVQKNIHSQREIMNTDEIQQIREAKAQQQQEIMNYAGCTNL